jgi:hypothetical protein
MYLEKTSIEEIITNLVKDYLKSNKYTQIRVIDESVYVQLSDKISSSINSDLLSLSENHPEFENKQLIREYAGYYLLDDFFEELYEQSMFVNYIFMIFVVDLSMNE